MGRPLKKTKTQMEKLIRLTWRNLQKHKVVLMKEQMLVIAALALTLDHYEREDRRLGSNHSRIFKRVYLCIKDISPAKILMMAGLEIRFSGSGFYVVRSGRIHLSEAAVETTEKEMKKVSKSGKFTQSDKTQNGYAIELDVSVNTLTRYTDEYIRVFEEFLKELNL